VDDIGGNPGGEIEDTDAGTPGPDDIPVFEEFYDFDEVWPQESLDRGLS